MADPHRPPRASRNKSFRKARDAGEHEIQAFRDVALDDLQKYFSPDTWKKMTDLHLQSAESLRKEGEPSSVEKYFEPAQWEKLHRLGVLKPQGQSSSPTSIEAAKNCFSPRSWDALVDLNVVPGARSPRTSRRAEASDDEFEGQHDEHDGILVDGMGDDSASLANAIHLEGIEDEPSVTNRLKEYFTDRHWKVLEERGVLQSALKRLRKETSV